MFTWIWIKWQLNVQIFDSAQSILSFASTLQNANPSWIHQPSPPSPSHHILAKVLIMRSCSPSFRCSAVAVFLIMIAFIIYSARQRNYMPELGHVWWKRVGEVAEEGGWDLVWGEAVAVPTSSPFDRNSRPRAQPIFKWARSIWPSALILGWV